MPQIQVSTTGGLDTYTNPLEARDGNIVHAVNFTSDHLGSKKKRVGYATLLGTPDNSRINSLFSWRQNDDSTFFLYRASGSSLYYSIAGTGAWTLAGNGTIGNGSPVSYAVLDNTLVVADPGGSTRYTTNGSNFTTINAAPPNAVGLAEYQNRIYAAGTSSFIFYSTTGTASDWTSDSSSLAIPGEGKMSTIFKASDRLMNMKNSGLMYRWDGDTLVDMATRLGPSSPYSLGSADDYKFWLNRLGIFVSNGGAPQLLSNPIQRQIYNDDSTGISGTSFGSAPGAVFTYDYLVAVGTITDDFTKIQQPNALIKYDYQKNDFLNWQFNNYPTAMHAYKDASGVNQFIFGDATGQAYQMGTQTSDNGASIPCSLVTLVHANNPFIEKEWRFLEVFANPGASAKVQFMVANTPGVFNPYGFSGPTIWKELGNIAGGYSILRFPPDARGRLLYLRFYESSATGRLNLYSYAYTFNVVPTR